ncbi:hypothetical protein [Pseudarthrobacter sp. BIM B-2242]|uniref:hypothetical protein n=1 Tax=Pseudarthrobacter sp. BIM B-2242 TaxID=2772401 RepID=UPI00168AE849|nr:hypothetical protein [Pseudarthrobacter sp. BIM B-2242]QOD03981.1 hypothetical protein IDT60_02465 [Pseudarthrobacter sp. BIM B-2242]
MTSNTSPLLRTVDEMLLDAGETDPGLRATLLSLGALASLPVPAPGGELAALLSAQPSQLARHRLRRSHRTAAASLAVIAGMGLGVTGVAATAPAPGPNASRSVQHMLQDWAPSWTVTGIPVAEAAGDLPWPPAAGPGSPDATVRDGSGPDDPLSDGSSLPGQGTSHQVTGEPGPNRPGTGAPGNDVQGSAGQGNGPGRSQDPGGATVSPGKPAADGGASRNGAATNGGGSSPDGTAPEGQGPGAAPGTDLAAGLEGAGRLVGGASAAVVDNLTPAILGPATTDPAGTEKTGAGNAGPGSIWLKKFSR